MLVEIAWALVRAAAVQLVKSEVAAQVLPAARDLAHDLVDEVGEVLGD